MTVAESISGALVRFGRPMTLRRETLAAGGVKIPLDVEVYGTADGWVPKSLAGSLAQGESVIVISNAEIAERQWPGPPKKNDVLIVDNKHRKIDGVESKYLSTTVLVHICKVTG